MGRKEDAISDSLNHNICKNFTSHKRIITLFLPYCKSLLVGPDQTNKEIILLLPKFLDLTMKQHKQNSDIMVSAKYAVTDNHQLNKNIHLNKKLMSRIKITQALGSLGGSVS